MEDVRFVEGNVIVGASFPLPNDKRYMKQKRYDIYLKDILQSLKQIIQYVGNCTLGELLQDEMRRDAVERRCTVSGEAAGQVPQAVRDKYPEIQWTQMVGFRHIVVHHYDGISYDKMWETIKNNLSQNIADMERICQLEKFSE
jgi:uncharacterized protein with HEPN domain